MQSSIQMKTKDHLSYDATAAIVFALKAKDARENAAMFKVDSDRMFEFAAEDLKKIKGLQKEVEAKRKSIIDPLNQSIKTINELFKAPKSYLEDAEDFLKDNMACYIQAQEAEREAQKATLEKEKEEEKARLLQLACEMSEEAADLKEQIETLKQNGSSQDEIDAMQSKIDELMSGAMTNEMLASQMICIEQAPIEVAGISKRTLWSAEVIDLMQLISAIAKGDAPLDCVQINSSFLNKAASSKKQEGELFAGVQCKKTISIAAKSE